MAKNKSKTQKTKFNYLDFLKSLTKWITSNNRSKDEIEELISKHKVSNAGLANRIVTYCLNNPHILWYMNKYFNHIYEFNRYDTVELAYSLAYVLDQNDQNKKNKLFFLKKDELKDDNKQKVKKNLFEYFRDFENRLLNDSELNYFYFLFTQNIITTSDIQTMYQKVNNTDEQIKLDTSQIQETSTNNEKEKIDEYIDYHRKKTHSQEIQNIIDRIKASKESRSKCQSCKLYQKQMVVLDTNVNEPQPVDFAFIALNPGKDELIYNKPLTGRAGVHHRKWMYYLHPNTSWLLTNILLCQTNNQKEIGKNDKEVMNVAGQCTDNLKYILQQFNARYYVVIGKNAMQIFGLKGSVEGMSGQIHDVGGAKVIPLIHPSAVIQYHGTMEAAYNYAMTNIIDLSYQLHGETFQPSQSQGQQTKQSESTQQHSVSQNNRNLATQYNIRQDQLIDEPDDSLTFFNAVNLDGKKLLLIFLDQNGQKYYKLESFKSPIFIKEQSFDQCDMIEDGSEMDYVVYTDGYNRSRILRDINSNTNIKKKSVTN